MVHAAILARAVVEDVPKLLEVVDQVGRRHETAIQLADPDAVYSGAHVESALLHAQRAFERGTNSAKTLGPEILLYLAGERRIQEAISHAGLRPGLSRAVVIAVGPRCGAAVWGLLDRLRWSKDPAGLAPNPRALERLGIPGDVRDPEGAVLERVALVDVRK